MFVYLTLDAVLCLGLKNKKLLMKKMLEENDIVVLCMQETEIMKDIDHNELRISILVSCYTNMSDSVRK